MAAKTFSLLLKVCITCLVPKFANVHIFMLVYILQMAFVLSMRILTAPNNADFMQASHNLHIVMTGCSDGPLA